DLAEIARTRSQAHLLAISGRGDIGEVVTDELVRRGSREVVWRVADNQAARFSERGFAVLVRRAERDNLLAEKVGARPDIPPRLFQELLMVASEVVRQRLLATADAKTRENIQRALTNVTREVSRDYTAARLTV